MAFYEEGHFAVIRRFLLHPIKDEDHAELHLLHKFGYSGSAPRFEIYEWSLSAKAVMEKARNIHA